MKFERLGGNGEAGLSSMMTNKEEVVATYKAGAIKRNLAPAANFENLQVGMVVS